MENKWMLIEAEDSLIYPVRFFDTKEEAQEQAQVRFCETAGWSREELTEYLHDDIFASGDWEKGLMSYFDDRDGMTYGWRVQEVTA